MALPSSCVRGHKKSGILRGAIWSLAVAVILCSLVSCGGGGPSGPHPDFSLSAQPATLVIAAGGTQSAQISVSEVNGLSSSVQVSASTPSGISVSPDSFSLTVGTSQQLTISAAADLSDKAERSGKKAEIFESAVVNGESADKLVKSLRAMNFTESEILELSQTEVREHRTRQLRAMNFSESEIARLTKKR
jgi:hypothetical protein